MTRLELAAYAANLATVWKYMESEGEILGDYQFVKLELDASVAELVLMLKKDTQLKTKCIITEGTVKKNINPPPSTPRPPPPRNQNDQSK